MLTSVDDEVDLREIVAIITRRAWVIFACVGVLASGAYLLSSQRQDLYAATAQVRITDPNSDTVFAGGVPIRVDPKREVDTQIQVVLSSEVRAEADRALAQNANQVTNVAVNGLGDTDILQIRAESPSPQVARDAANAVADAYVRRRQTQLVATLEERAAELRKKATGLTDQIRQIDADLAAGELPAASADALRSQRAGLVDQQNDFEKRASESEVEAAIRSGNVEIIDHATLPEAPFAPRPTRDAALAAALGLLLGLGIVFLLERLDDAVRLDDIEALTGAPVLGTIPLRTDKRLRHHHLPDVPRLLVDPTSVEAEAFRSLRTGLRFSNLGRAKRIIAITSPSGSEGKSTTTANLANSLAENGQRVAAVSADLRRPALAQFFGLDDGQVGLTSVLLGDVALREAIVRLPPGDLAVLPAGPAPHNPAELLGSKPMGDLLDRLVEAGAEFVLIDCPPILPVSDPLVLAQYVDGLILLCVPGQTKAHELATACEKARQVGVEIIGIVVNGLSTSKGRYGQYYRQDAYTSSNGNGTKPGRSRRTRGTESVAR